MRFTRQRRTRKTERKGDDGDKEGAREWIRQDKCQGPMGSVALIEKFSLSELPLSCWRSLESHPAPKKRHLCVESAILDPPLIQSTRAESGSTCGNAT